MRKFIKNVTSISAILLILIVILVSLRVAIVRSHSWEIPKEKHILFMGASHVQHGIDDSMMESAINWARGSERYMFTYIKLERLLKDNQHLDTVFLELAPTDLWEDTDYKYFDEIEQAGYIPYYWPFFTIENWVKYKAQPKQVMVSILSSLLNVKGLTHKSLWDNMGGYKRVSDVMDLTKIKPLLNKNTGCGHEINYHYLSKIIDLCKKNDVKLIFMETPTFHPENYYDIEYFYHTYQTNFSDIEFIDYSKWTIPLDEMCDAHRLSHKGAVRFTKEIKRRYNIK